jgi:hypothetical protein
VANFLGRLQTFLFGAAIGRASSDAVTPVLEPVRQHAWFRNQNKVLDPAAAAELLAKRFITEEEAQFDANRGGIADNRLAALTLLAQTYPGLSELVRLSNREILTPERVKEVLGHHGIPDTYTDAYLALFQEILTPGELAAAIHRGLVPAEGLVLGEQPQPPFKVDAYPVEPIDALAEARGSGLDAKRLQVLVGLQGLPMGPHEAAQALFRGIITHGDYIRAFNTSNMRNEWAQAIMEQTRQIPTARDFFENALRGYHDLAWAQEQAKRHGMSEADSLVIYQNQGRPMAVSNITKALARGGVFAPEPGELTDPYEASIVEGNVKPAYYDLAKALRYSYPSAFLMRSLAQAGDITEADFAQYGKEQGWPPDLADKIAHAVAKPAAAAVNPYVGKAETQLWTALHKAYVAGALDDPTVDSYLTNLIDDASARAEVILLWQTEKDIGARSGPPA